MLWAQSWVYLRVLPLALIRVARWQRLIQWQIPSRGCLLLYHDPELERKPLTESSLYASFGFLRSNGQSLGRRVLWIHAGMEFLPVRSSIDTLGCVLSKWKFLSRLELRGVGSFMGPYLRLLNYVLILRYSFRTSNTN